MTREISGNLDASGLKFGIILSRFNDFIGQRLLSGAIDVLVRHGCNEDDITVVRVPGAFEIATVAKKMAQTKDYDALICLGAVIRGGTPHFDYVASESIKGVAKVSQEFVVPVGLGIITTDTLEQAIERAGSKMGNKGADAAMSALEMATLFKALK